MSGIVTLVSGPMRADVLPGLGAALARLTHDGIDLMRPSRGELPNDQAMFLMAPWANRLAANRVTGGGRSHDVEPNVPGQPLALHGSAWRSVFTVEERAEDRVALSLDGVVGPWRYDMDVTYALDPGGLEVRLAIVNRGAFDLPFGCGLHPYFERAGAGIAFAATGFWLEGPDRMPTDRISLPPELDFAGGRPVPSRWRNATYDGWDGRATITRPGAPALRIVARLTTPHDSSPVRHLHLWTPPGESFFCLEPQTHRPGAFAPDAGPEDGAVVLAPGESMEMVAAFRVDA
jgi:aldose 1-epimerase